MVLWKRKQLTIQGTEVMKKIMVTRTSMPDYEEYIEAIRPLWDCVI